MNVIIPDPRVVHIGLLNLNPTMRAATLQAVELIPEVHISDIDVASLEIPRPEMSIRPDVILMGEADTKDTTAKHIRFTHSYFSPSRLIVIVHCHEGGDFGNFLESGATGIVCMEATSGLSMAIHAVKEGRLYIDVCQSNHPLNLGTNASSKEELKEFSQGTDFLSSREKHVLLLTAKGYMNQQIADRLDVSIKSIENDKRKLKSRLELESRSDIVKFALEQGILNVDK